MKQALERLLWAVHRFEDMVLVLLLLGMIMLAFTQIVLRNGFDGGFLWADALLRVLVLWIALLGAMVASREQRHINIDLISRFLSPAGKRVAGVVAAAFTSAICAALAWYCLDFVRMEYESPSPAFASVPTWVCESIMPFAFALIAVRYLVHCLRIAFVGLPVEKSL
jgi:TRAP-type C4-dicarboxylate transport system permease small subunit